MTANYMANRRRVLKAASAVGITGVAGCMGGDGGGNEGQDVDLEAVVSGDIDLEGREVHFITDESETRMQEFFNMVASDFEAETGAIVNIEYAGFGAAIEERMAQLIQSGNPPELFHQGVDPGSLQFQEGILHPVTPILDVIIDRMGTPPEDHRIQDEDGEDHIVPWYATPNFNFYREDIVDWEPTSWEENLEWLAEADEAGGTANATYVPAATNWATELHQYGYAVANDAQIAGRDGDGNIEIIMDQGSNRDRWIETIEYLDAMHEYSPLATDATFGTATDAIPEGQAANMQYAGLRPKIQAIQRGRDFAADVRCHPVPTGQGSPDRIVGNPEGFTVIEGSDVEAAYAFLNHFYQMEYMEEFHLITPLHNSPIYPEIRDYVDYREHLPSEWSDADIERSLDAGQNIVTLSVETDPVNPWAGAIFGSELQSEMNYEVMVNDMDPEEALDDYADQLRDVLERARG